MFAPAEQLVINNYIIKTSPDEHDLYGAKRTRGERQKRKCCVPGERRTRELKCITVLGNIIIVNRNNNATFQ